MYVGKYKGSNIDLALEVIPLQLNPVRLKNLIFGHLKFIFCWLIYILYMFILWYWFNMESHPICHAHQMVLPALLDDLHP